MTIDARNRLAPLNLGASIYTASLPIADLPQYLATQARQLNHFGAKMIFCAPK
jgi:hypothetical protein